MSALNQCDNMMACLIHFFIYHVACFQHFKCVYIDQSLVSGQTNWNRPYFPNSFEKSVINTVIFCVSYTNSLRYQNNFSANGLLKYFGLEVLCPTGLLPCLLWFWSNDKELLLKFSRELGWVHCLNRDWAWAGSFMDKPAFSSMLLTFIFGINPAAREKHVKKSTAAVKPMKPVPSMHHAPLEPINCVSHKSI